MILKLAAIGEFVFRRSVTELAVPSILHLHFRKMSEANVSKFFFFSNSIFDDYTFTIQILFIQSTPIVFSPLIFNRICINWRIIMLRICSGKKKQHIRQLKWQFKCNEKAAQILFVHFLLKSFIFIPCEHRELMQGIVDMGFSFFFLVIHQFAGC